MGAPYGGNPHRSFINESCPDNSDYGKKGNKGSLHRTPEGCHGNGAGEAQVAWLDRRRERLLDQGAATHGLRPSYRHRASSGAPSCFLPATCPRLREQRDVMSDDPLKWTYGGRRSSMAQGRLAKAHSAAASHLRDQISEPLVHPRPMHGDLPHRCAEELLNIWMASLVEHGG